MAALRAARMSRRAKLRRFGRADIVAHLMPDASRYTPAVKITLQLIALVAIVIMLARPRYGATEKTETSAGIEVMIAFDVSNSMMASSTDRPDGIPRIDRARLLLEKLVDKLDNDKVGPDNLCRQLQDAAAAYERLLYRQDVSQRTFAVVDQLSGHRYVERNQNGNERFLTGRGYAQGDNLDYRCRGPRRRGREDCQACCRERNTARRNRPRNLQGAILPGFTDNEGRPVVTKLNEEIAKEIAKAGDGIYVNGASPSALSDLENQLDKLQKSEFSSVNYTAGAEQFPTFAFLAFLFLLIDVFVVERKISWLKGVNFFTGKK